MAVSYFTRVPRPIPWLSVLVLVVLVSNRTAIGELVPAEGESEQAGVEDKPGLPQVKHLIDTHIHLYDTRRDVYELGRADRVPWPPTDDGILHKPHLPEEFHRVTKPAGVTGVVIVEASPRIDDNDWVLDLVRDDDFFIGLVGNIDPFKESFAKDLARLKRDPRFVGIRVHFMNRGVGVSKNKVLLSNLHELAKAGLTLDVLMNGEGPETIDEVANVAKQVPKLRIVTNHVLGYDIDGKMPGDDWISAVKHLAEYPNVWVKISGLYQRCQIQPAPHDVQHYDELLDVLWDHFGVDRLIYGSNWPCTKKSGDYVSFVKLVNAYFHTKGADADERFFWKNAARAYKLPLE